MTQRHGNKDKKEEGGKANPEGFHCPEEIDPVICMHPNSSVSPVWILYAVSSLRPERVCCGEQP